MHLFFYAAFIVLVALAAGPLYSDTMPVQKYGFFSASRESAALPVLATSTSLLFTGDVMLARRVEAIMDANGPDYLLRRMPPLQELAESVVINFEASIPTLHRQTPELTMSFSVDSVYAAFLKESGITHASLANNHSYDNGLAGFMNTQRVLKDNDISPFGDQKLATTSYAVIKKGAVSVGLFGLYAVDTAPLEDAITALHINATSTDVQIAYIHWGTEYAPVHSPIQEKIAQTLIDAGFDAVIGHHPHVVQDIGWYKGVPIFYSLGNFIFDQYFSAAVQEGLLLSVEATPLALTFSLLPHTSLDARTQPRLLNVSEKALFLKALAAKSTPALADDITNGTIVSVLSGCNSCVID